MNATHVIDPRVLKDLKPYGGSKSTKGRGKTNKKRDTACSLLDAHTIRRVPNTHGYVNKSKQQHPSMNNTLIGRSLKSEYEYNSGKSYLV